MRRNLTALLTLSALALCFVLCGCGSPAQSDSEGFANSAEEAPEQADYFTGTTWTNEADEMFEFGTDGSSLRWYQSKDVTGDNYIQATYRVLYDDDAADYLNDAYGYSRESTIGQLDRIQKTTEEELRFALIVFDEEYVIYQGERHDPGTPMNEAYGVLYEESGYFNAINVQSGNYWRLTRDGYPGVERQDALSIIAQTIADGGSIEDVLVKTETSGAEDFEPQVFSVTDLKGFWSITEVKYSDGYVQGEDEIAAMREQGKYSYLEIFGITCEVVLDSRRVYCLFYTGQDDSNATIDGPMGKWTLTYDGKGLIRINTEDGSWYIAERAEKPDGIEGLIVDVG